MTESSTAVALLDAAETEFAEHGIDQASLRSIMRTAGANTAAVHYHYGSREELAKAVLDRVLAPLQARRLDLLSELTAAGDPPTAAGLIEALIRPDFEAAVAVGLRNPNGVRIIGTIYSRPAAFVKSLVEESFAPVAARFMPHLMAATPGLSPDELGWRVRWCVFGVLGALFSDDETVITDENMESQLARVLASTLGAVVAPPAKENRQ